MAERSKALDLRPNIVRSCGAMDNASAYGAEDCRCSMASCYRYPGGYMPASSHYLSRVSYLMKRHVETRVSDQNLNK
uniref:Uncharacterized protein n=1 Tax=Strongyloides venezuelensis TaxID=75913 RepID=A0A0K0FSP0_STRVS